ncbi:MAG: ferric reductase-like transmembrane domain-containing protein [Candidatus Nanopelagicales bacterium]|nr:ferric reductase-like transmembrane domain-containing protein [Candidatus Nanopelagicales bacterium]
MADIAWTWIGIRASGVTAWGLLTAVVLWGILLRTRVLGKAASPTRLLDLHRWLGVTALAFLALHMLLLLFDPFLTFSVAQVLVPGLSAYEPLAVALGVVAFWFLIPVSIIGRIRSRMAGSGARLFQRSHWLAYAAWPLATAHYVLAGTDALTEWSIGVLIAGSGLLVMGLLARGFIPAPGPTRAAGSVVIRS